MTNKTVDKLQKRLWAILFHLHVFEWNRLFHQCVDYKCFHGITCVFDLYVLSDGIFYIDFACTIRIELIICGNVRTVSSVIPLRRGSKYVLCAPESAGRSFSLAHPTFWLILVWSNIIQVST